jgi:hypothetical protein
MTSATAVILHVGSHTALSLIEYLYRVLFHLVAVGGLALLVRWVIRIGTDNRSGAGGRHQ